MSRCATAAPPAPSTRPATPASQDHALSTVLPCWALCSWTLLLALPSTVSTQDSQPQPCLPLFLAIFFFLFFTTWQFFPSYLSPQNCQPQRSAGTLQRDSKCLPDGGMSPGLLLGAHPSQPWPPSCNLGWLKPATKKLLEGVRPGCKHHTALLVCSFGPWTASSL